MFYLKKINLKDLIKEPKVIIALSCVVLILMIALAVVAIDALETASYVPNGGKDAADIIASESLTLTNDIGKQKISASYAELESNYKAWNSNEQGLTDGIFCITTDSASNIVFDIDSNNVAAEGKSFSNYNYWWIDSGCTDFYAVINISGKVIDLKDYYILTRDETGIYGSRALLNFYEAEAVDLSGATVIGNVLAPYAAVNCNNVTLYGQINGKEVVGEMAYQKDLPFAGYKQLTNDFEAVTFHNDAVRVAAIEYLISNDFENKYTNYKTTSSFKMVDVNEVKKISIYSNGETLTSLEEDLAIFPQLQEVIISGADIESFSTDLIPEIKVLTIEDTTISSLDISSATKLQKLVIDGNPALKTFNYNQNEAMQILSYANTPLGWIDYQKFPNLYYLDCSGSQVKSNLTISGENLQNLKMLDVSYNSNIMTIYLNTFPKLEMLNCSNCPIKSLDFNGADKLQFFKGSNLRIPNFDFKPAKALAKIEVFGETVQSVDVTDLPISALYYDAHVEIIGLKLPEGATMGGSIITGALVNGQIVNGVMIDGKIIYDTSGNSITEDQIVSGIMVNGQIVNGVMINGKLVYYDPVTNTIVGSEDGSVVGDISNDNSGDSENNAVENQEHVNDTNSSEETPSVENESNNAGNNVEEEVQNHE